MEKLELIVAKAVNGDKIALEQVVKQTQDMLYNLALKMLWHPEEAKDATQEILIKMVTNLSKFGNRSSFKTWVYRLACNELLNYKAKHFRKKLNFEDFQWQLNQDQSEQISVTQNKAEKLLLIQEAKIGCSSAMLQCLDRESRLTYIVGEILAFNSNEAASILSIKPEAFRKRLSRIRVAVRSFVSQNCGLVNQKNDCRCHKKVDSNINLGIINRDNLLFASKDNKKLVKIIDNVQNEVALFQSNPNYMAPKKLLREVKRILTTSGL